MWLRWVVSNFLQQVADRKIRQVVSKARDAVEGDRDTEDTQGDPGQRLPKECDIALLFALELEANALLDRMTHVVTTRCATCVEHSGILDGQRLLVVETGAGQESARQAAEDVIQIHQPAWIVAAGFSASLDKRLRLGHIVMPDTIVDGQHEVLKVGFQIDGQVVEQSPSLHVGRLLTVDELVRSTERKRELAHQYEAVACDMETMAIAKVCRERQVRFLAVRVVSDGLDDKIPTEVECMLDQSSLAGKLGAATLALMQRPKSLKQLWQLRERALQTAERLAQYVTGVLPQLTR